MWIHCSARPRQPFVGEKGDFFPGWQQVTSYWTTRCQVPTRSAACPLAPRPSWHLEKQVLSTFSLGCPSLLPHDLTNSSPAHSLPSTPALTHQPSPKRPMSRAPGRLSVQPSLQMCRSSASISTVGSQHLQAGPGSRWHLTSPAGPLPGKPQETGVKGSIKGGGGMTQALPPALLPAPPPMCLTPGPGASWGVAVLLQPLTCPRGDCRCVFLEFSVVHLPPFPTLP